MYTKEEAIELLRKSSRRYTIDEVTKEINDVLDTLRTDIIQYAANNFWHTDTHLNYLDGIQDAVMILEETRKNIIEEE